MTNNYLEKAMIIPGMMWPSEMHTLAQLVRNSQSHVEVGAFCGKSLYVTAYGMKTGVYANSYNHQLFAIDDLSETSFCPSSGWVLDVLNSTIRCIANKFGIITTYRQMCSIKAMEVHSKEQLIHDSIFIDANHSQEMVCRDILGWWGLLKEGGIMIGHDYSDEFMSVKNAVNSIFPRTFKTHTDTRFWSVIKTEQTNEQVVLFRSRS